MLASHNDVALPLQSITLTLPRGHGLAALMFVIRSADGGCGLWGWVGWVGGKRGASGVCGWPLACGGGGGRTEGRVGCAWVATAWLAWPDCGQSQRRR